MLSAGARLVLIPQQAQREAAIWLSLVQQHQVTVWNSVPALLEMMLLFNEQIFNEQDEQPPALPSLRVVMLSGDWIVPELPQRLRRFAPNAHCVAMGGGHGSGYLVQLLDSRYSANRVVLGALRRAIA